MKQVLLGFSGFLNLCHRTSISEQEEEVAVHIIMQGWPVDCIKASPELFHVCVTSLMPQILAEVRRAERDPKGRLAAPAPWANYPIRYMRLLSQNRNAG
jgi:hypothetical protein